MVSVPPYVLHVLITERVQGLALQFFVNQFARYFTQVLHCFPFDRII
jgi:hypothetical protein